MDTVADIFRIVVSHSAGPIPSKGGKPVSAEYSVEAEHVSSSDGLPVSSQEPLNLPEEFEKELRRQLLVPRGYGTLLGKAVFHGAVLERFRTALAMTKPGRHLGVRLTVEAPELMSLRWERICIPSEADGWNHLALDQRAPFSIELPTPCVRNFPVMTRDELRALVVLADQVPDNAYQLGHFGAAELAGGLSASLADIAHDILGPGAVGNAVGPATLSELCSRLAAGHASGQPYTLLHLVAHGRVCDNGHVVYLMDENEQTEPCTADKMIGQLNGIARLPHLVFLSSCESAMPTKQNAPNGEDALGGMAQKFAVELGIPAVSAMTASASVKMATQLACRFYPQLRRHGMPDLALAEAKAGMQGHADVTVPVLFSRLRGRRLFSEPQGPPTAAMPRPKPKLAHEPELVEIPAGPFWMGSDPAPGIPAHETPRHKVDLPRFFIGRTPVTCSQYEKFLCKTKHSGKPNGWYLCKPPKGKEDHPVTDVSWEDAVAYCAWLSKLSGKVYRLPSEAEWEKAARGSDGRTYPWGNDWQDGCCNCNPDGISNGATAPADAFPKGASPFGCLDMLGNVQEWTSTSWGDGSLQAEYAYPFQMDDRDDPDLGSLGKWRIHRGGCFRNQPGSLRCAMRGRAAAKSKCDWLGFRVAMVD